VSLNRKALSTLPEAAATCAFLFLGLLAAGAVTSARAQTALTLIPLGGAPAAPPASASQGVTPGKILGSPIGVPGAPTLNTPTGVAVDLAGRVYVANKNSNRVTVYSPALAPVGVISAGLNGPIAVAISGAFGNSQMRIYVANNDGDNVTVYNPDLSQNTAATIADSAHFSHPFSTYIDPAGDIWVLDRLHATGYRFDGTYFASLTGYSASAIGPVNEALAAFGATYNNSPSTILVNLGLAAQGSDFNLVEINQPALVGGAAEDQFAQTYFSDANNNRIFIVSPSLAPLDSIKTASAPWGVAVDRNYNRIYVAEPSANQVEVFGLKPPHLLMGVIK
jgi:DNA-binding beta-propeller fold protein YncE